MLGHSSAEIRGEIFQHPGHAVAAACMPISNSPGNPDRGFHGTHPSDRDRTIRSWVDKKRTRRKCRPNLDRLIGRIDEGRGVIAIAPDLQSLPALMVPD